MTAHPTVTWHLQQVMRDADIYSNEALKRHLADAGVPLSSSQVHRLVTETPERLNLTVLAALCQVLAVDPSDLIEVTETTQALPAVADGNGNVVDLADQARPRRARVLPDDQA